jgi:5-methylcytosine-specific restriction endonuclease McrBC regulatory subunit McrC
VTDAISVIAVDDLQIIIEPKIPTSHLIYLLEASGQVPRIGGTSAHLARQRSFWELVARWYVTALEQLLRSDLIRDYRLTRDALNVVRGRIDTRKTVLDFLSDKALVTCEFEKFDHDNPLNRVLLAAARTVAASTVLIEDVRRRARRVTSRMDGVGLLEPGDLRSTLERRSAHYREPVTLAAHVLEGHGRGLETGGSLSRSFLFRTPDLVEEGIRRTLAITLGDRWHIIKHGIQLGSTTMKVTPDLLFEGGLATGDVKYKLTDREWNTGDFYQAIAFATAFRARAGCVISFAKPDAAPLPQVPVGDVELTSLTWSAEETSEPQESALRLATQVEDWLSKTHERRTATPTTRVVP